jgi:glucose/arabinose dehydrogenase/HEAT repeat protein
VNAPLFRPAALLPCLAAACLVGAAGRADDKPAAEPPKFIDQGDHDPRLKGVQTPEGFLVEVVAESPVVADPLALAFADDGAPYVLERPADPADGKEAVEEITYKDGAVRKLAVAPRRVKGAVKVLRDTKGKGVYDEAKVVVEDDLPTGLLLDDGWLYLCGRGSVRRYKQGKADGPFDVTEVVARGFGGFGPRQVSGMAVGADGRLYLACGSGDNDVEGSDGSRAAALGSGAVFRCRPDGAKLEIFATGFDGPSGAPAFDTMGRLFAVDAAGEGRRLLYVAEGADCGRLPPLLKSGRGAAAGVCFYDDSRFPEGWRGRLYAADPDRREVRAYQLRRKGASFEVAEEVEFLRGDAAFRPCCVTSGPDGALYVVDRREGGRGRIYKVTWSGTKDQPALTPRPMDSWAKVAKLGDDDLIKALCGDDATDHARAGRELARRGKGRPALWAVLKDREQPLSVRAAALGALDALWNDSVQRPFQTLLESESPDLRRLAADALGRNAATGDGEAHAALLKALGDRDPAVRRAVALAISRVAAEAAPDNLVVAWSFEEGPDPYLRDGLVHAIENLGKPGIERLVALSESGVQKDIDKVADSFALLRTRPAAEAVPDLLKSPHLSPTQRAALVRSYGAYRLDPPVSPAPVLDYLTARPDEDAAVKRAGLEVLSSAGALKGDKAAAWLLGLLKEKDADLRLAALRAVADAKPAGAAPALRKLLADPSLPEFDREAAAKALRAVEGPDGK